MKRWRLFLPLALFLGLCALLYVGLFRDANPLPSTLLNAPLPAFRLATVADPQRWITAIDLQGEPALINIWATWCMACRIEHPFLLKLSAQGVPLYGINYKDDQDEAKRWLQQRHNPYRFSVNDRLGRLAIDLGVYGAPETYLIDHTGTIRYKHVGIIDEHVWQAVLKPHYQALRADRDSPSTSN